MKWRANDTAASWTGGTYSNATLSLATAAVDYSAASPTWTANVGPDYTQVHNGPVTHLPGTGNGVGVPGPYVIDIPVNPPFLYDPNAGDLVVDTEWVTGAWGGGTFSGMDVMTTGVLASRVYSSSMYPTANGVDAAAPVIEVGFIPAGPGTFATNTPTGQGCIRRFASFYEYFATPTAFDLGGNGITLIPTGTSYIVTTGATFLPVGSVQPVPTQLVLGDDAQITVPFTVGSFAGPTGPWTGLNVISNGIVSQAAGNSLVAAPSPATLLSAPQTGFYTQGDWDPSVGGYVWFEESAGISMVTWDNVPSWNVPGSLNTFQMQFQASGIVSIGWVSMATGGANGGVLVGYSPAGASADPGSTDISALTQPIVLDPADSPPLTLAGVTRPIINTNWNLTTSNIPPTGVIGVDVFGLADPGINDLFFIGMPGCGLRASLDALSAWPVAGVTHNYGLAIPNSPALVNVHVYTTSAVFQVPPANAFGAITSNGIDGRLGDL